MHPSGPSGPVGKMLKPFVESGFRDWVRAVSSEPWFRKIVSVDKDENGKGHLYFGGKDKGYKFPLEKGIAGLTAATGLAHINIARSPMATWVINEMIDEIGPALRDAYREGRIPSEKEIEKAKKALDELGNTTVRVIWTANRDGNEAYAIHHAHCFSRDVRSEEEGDGEDVYTFRHAVPMRRGGRLRKVRYVGRGLEMHIEHAGKKGLLVPLKDALAMDAKPNENCRVCAQHLGKLIEKRNELEEDTMPPKKKEVLSFGEILNQLSLEKRHRILDYQKQWREKEPHTGPAEIQRLNYGVNRLAEAELLADARNLAEFQHLMRSTLYEASTGRSLASSLQHFWKQSGIGANRRLPGGGRYETAGECYARHRKEKGSGSVFGILSVFWPFGNPFKLIPAFGKWIMKITGVDNAQ